MQKTIEKETVSSPTQAQFFYRHRNERYYVRTFAGGKEIWTSLKTRLLTVARNRMKITWAQPRASGSASPSRFVTFNNCARVLSRWRVRRAARGGGAPPRRWGGPFFFPC